MNPPAFALAKNSAIYPPSRTPGACTQARSVGHRDLLGETSRPAMPSFGLSRALESKRPTDLSELVRTLPDLSVPGHEPARRWVGGWRTREVGGTVRRCDAPCQPSAPPLKRQRNSFFAMPDQTRQRPDVAAPSTARNPQQTGGQTSLPERQSRRLTDSSKLGLSRENPCKPRADSSGSVTTASARR